MDIINIKTFCSSMQPLKTEKMETEQNSVDDSGFVHMLL